MNDDVYLSLQGDAVVLKHNDDEKLRLPINAIEMIIIFGNTTISNHLVKACSKSGVIISYVNMHGNYVGRFTGPQTGNVSLRYKQYKMYDDEERSLLFVKNIMLAKFLNSANLLKYYSRFTKDDDTANQLYNDACQILEHSKKLKDMEHIDEIRGLEGSISSLYFNDFDLMLKVSDPEMLFDVRSKHPPMNNCNALLSFLYTLYTINVSAALESFGLDSQLGYMHRMRSGRSSLSCDIIEEFRSPIVDRFVIKIINLSQVKSKDFEKTCDGIRLKPDSQKRILQLWESYKNEEIYHPFLKTKIKIKLLPYIQAQLLSQFIRGDIDSYPAFYYKLT